MRALGALGAIQAQAGHTGLSRLDRSRGSSRTVRLLPCAFPTKRSHQKRNFTPNWNSRALVAVAWIRPNELDDKSVTGTPRFTWLKMLNPSMRTSSDRLAPSGTRLMNDRSVFTIPGPRTTLRAALPD